MRSCAIQDERMNSADATPEVRRHWRQMLREQGRTLTWLAQETGKSYPVIQTYANGRTPPPLEWLERVYELLGEPTR